MSSPTRFGAIVTQDSILRQLFRQATENRAFDLRIKHLLNEPLSRHIQVAIVHDASVVLIADSPAWAAKLRYEVPKLHRRLSEDTAFPNIETIRVKVAKSNTPPQPRVHRPRPLSRATAEEMKRLAKSLEDPVLREAILRLAGRQEQ